MASTLPIITTGAGTQNATQDTQTAGTSAGAGTPSSSVQPGAVGDLNSTTAGVPLSSSQLSTVALSTSTSTIVKPDVAPHHTNLASTGVSVLFFIMAVGLLIAIFMPAKNTTN